jgi:hypothetical protein
MIYTSNKYLKITVIALAVMFIALDGNPVCAQGHMQLLNGKERRYTNASVKGEFIIYEPEGKTGKSKKINRFDVFSLNPDNGPEEVLYTPDTTYDDEPSVEEVRDYVNGEKLALSYYREHPRFAGSQLYFGFYSGFFGSLLGYYGAAVVPIYAMGVDRFGPDLPKERMDEWNESPAFVTGYEKVMRNKKVKNSLIGGAIGFTVGITTLAVILD